MIRFWWWWTNSMQTAPCYWRYFVYYNLFWLTRASKLPIVVNNIFRKRVYRWTNVSILLNDLFWTFLSFEESAAEEIVQEAFRYKSSVAVEMLFSVVKSLLKYWSLNEEPHSPIALVLPNALFDASISISVAAVLTELENSHLKKIFKSSYAFFFVRIFDKSSWKKN